MKRKAGDRVYAMVGADPDTKTLKVLGPGVYDGDDVPTGAVGFVADAAREYRLKNPKITLDTGEVVWGCECWWGDEEGGKQTMEQYKRQGWTVVTVTMAEERAKVEAHGRA